MVFSSKGIFMFRCERRFMDVRRGDAAVGLISLSSMALPLIPRGRGEAKWPPRPRGGLGRWLRSETLAASLCPANVRIIQNVQNGAILHLGINTWEP